MSVRKWMFAGALLLAAGVSSLGFAQKPGLKFNPDKKFTVYGLACKMARPSFGHRF